MKKCGLSDGKLSTTEASARGWCNVCSEKKVTGQCPEEGEKK